MDLDNKKDHLSLLRKRETQIRTEKMRLYEDYAVGSLSKEDYLTSKTKAERELKTIHEQIEKCGKLIAELERERPQQKTPELELAERFGGQKELTNEMAKAFVKAVYIQADGHVEIKWKFKDPFPEAYK